MAKRKQREESPVSGTTTAVEIFNAVGSALSWWEGAEDELMGVYRELLADDEPSAFESYVDSPRSRRDAMLKAALQRYAHKFEGEEVERLRSAMNALGRLSEVRNQIAHGHCSNQTRTVEGEVVMAGHYLLPSLNEGSWHERSVRYAHTADTIRAFEKKVREHRSVVQDIRVALLMRNSEAQQSKYRNRASLPPEVQQIIAIAEAIVAERIPPEAVSQILKLAEPPSGAAAPEIRGNP
jgi:hypothetical protein